MWVLTRPTQYKTTQPESTPARSDKSPGGKLSTFGVFTRLFPENSAADETVPLDGGISGKCTKSFADILQGRRIIEQKVCFGRHQSGNGKEKEARIRLPTCLLLPLPQIRVGQGYPNKPCLRAAGNRPVPGCGCLPSLESHPDNRQRFPAARPERQKKLP